MKAIAALLALITLPALADEGFFRHVESAPHEKVNATAADVAPVPCALDVRYNIARPVAQQITYIASAATCMLGYETAMHTVALAAGAVSKVAGPTDPSAGPRYDCTIAVAFDAATPATAAATYAGSGCESSRNAALAAAVGNIACVFHNGVLCPQ